MNDGGGIYVAVDSIGGKRDWVYLHDSMLDSAENSGSQGVDTDSAFDAEQDGMQMKKTPALCVTVGELLKED